MSAKYEIHATNDLTATLVAVKYTLPGALTFAVELFDCWDDIHIREREENSNAFKIIAKLSPKGLWI